MKFERRKARAARKGASPFPGAQPDAADISQIPPIPAEESNRLASRGVVLNRGNSDLQNLSPVGREEVADVASKLADKGGVDEIQTSPALRAEETAQAVASQNPTPVPVSENPNLESWAQGNLEGQPLVAVKKQIQDLIRKQPGRVIPGQGQLSSKSGESFNTYRTRALSAVRGLMQELANDPTKKIGVPDHSSVTKLARAWLANGTPDDFSIKPSAMEKENPSPGSVIRLFPNQDGEWEMNQVDLGNQKPLDPGIYFIRHGPTPWNPETYQRQGDAEDAMSQIGKTVQALDLGRARAAAQKAVSRGHLTDDQVDDAIDASLPPPKEAADLPLHQLLAVATAASPSKRPQYMPLLKKLGDLGSLPPDAASAIQNHIASLGTADQNA